MYKSDTLNDVDNAEERDELEPLLATLKTKIDEKLEPVPLSNSLKSLNYKNLELQNEKLELRALQETEHLNQMEVHLKHEKLLLIDDTKALSRFKSDKKAVNNRYKKIQRSKLHPLLKEEPEYVVEIDNELIRDNLRSLNPTNSTNSTNSTNYWDPEKDQRLYQLNDSFLSKLCKIEQQTQPLDGIIMDIDEMEDSLVQLMNLTNLRTKMTEKLLLK
ncbi:19633_t:CDS:2 [Entrophospora sp. SA101]|nr:7078_t:CDS:2 [Entrophospora sp. SA101]CAJ0626991.1 5572_t:CDS:2 [Entrophospora sp. SA101]CAJ0760434.1 19633_t:CDS:2 [Entrophospora sp. SA101]CAJ0831988.1 11480_t:CDS:2 [Entrophospora sp. SA101]CAJ0851646.1 19978_t:CDS:2 [Entrophospora sp. SA101]